MEGKRTYKQQRGDWGEGVAASFLVLKGFCIEAQNYFAREGEIDIVVSKHEENESILGFVEVKTRKYRDGSGMRSVGSTKLQKMMRAARRYCYENNIEIDVTIMAFYYVGVCGDEAHYTIDFYTITW